MTSTVASIAKPDLLQWNLANASRAATGSLPPNDIRDLVRSNQALPPLPALAKRLWALRDDEMASARSLADVIQLDPLLSAQVLRRANAASQGASRVIETVQDAVIRLGFGVALNVALALAAMSPLRTPNHGPIGRDRLWQHGLRCGLMMQELARQQSGGCQLPLGLLQLSGITHDIGYLLLGHLLPDQFKFVSQLIAANPALSLPTIDRFALGIEHAQLGEWLFEAWDMPTPLLLAVRHHHNPAYSGDSEQLVWLTGLAESLLEQAGAGLGGQYPPDAHRQFADRLGLANDACAQALERVLASE